MIFIRSLLVSSCFFVFLSGQTATAQTVGPTGPAAHFDSDGGAALVDPVTGGLISNGRIAQSKHRPILKHFFPGDSVRNGKVLTDEAGGLLMIATNAVFSVSTPEYVNVAASNSGKLHLSAPFNLAGSKPFYIMAMYSNTPGSGDKGLGDGLAGFWFDALSDPNPAPHWGFELWNSNPAVSASNMTFREGAVWGNVFDTGSTTAVSREGTAVGLFYDPASGTVDFFYAGDNAGTPYWEARNYPLAPELTALPPTMTTVVSPISNPYNGLRKFYGFIVYEFDSKPTDWKAATVEMRENWLKGKKVPYSGW